MIKAIYVYITSAILFSKPWAFLIRHVLWRFRISNYYTKTNGKQFELCRSVIKRGDHLLSADYAKMTSKFIPGSVDHYAIFDDCKNIYEMVHVGFRTTTLFDFFKESDRVVVMRTVDADWTERYVDIFIEKAKEYWNRVYDASFSFGIDALYCSELGYHADVGRVIQLDTSDLLGIGQPYVSPEAFLLAKNNVCIFDSSGEFTGMSGCEIEKIIDSKKV